MVDGVTPRTSESRRPMLAYVFWHWKQPSVGAAEYEERQRAFHAALAGAPPAGFVRSMTSAIAGAPWAAGGGEAYEDWYLLRDFSALEPLNDAAVTGSRQRAHDTAAAAAAGGTAGLYGLRLGEPGAHPADAHWFAKPTGMSYAELSAALAPLIDAVDGALWMRQMVLGPTPEFCLHASRPLEVPPPFRALPLALRPLWPEDVQAHART